MNYLVSIDILGNGLVCYQITNVNVGRTNLANKNTKVPLRTPECDRWGKVHSKAVGLHEFLDFLSSKEIILCMSNEHGYFPMMTSKDQLIYDFFKIDADKLEKERRELLRSIQQ